MSRAAARSSAGLGNSVVNAVVAMCAVYRVPVLRMQSRVHMVVGVGGKERPMITGEWTDLRGEKHTRGMADLLAMPRVHHRMTGSGIPPTVAPTAVITVPLWIECKAGSGKLTADQKAFQHFVEEAGALYFCAHDSAAGIEEFFKANGVRR